MPIAAGRVQVKVVPAEENLHYAWDDAVVAVEKQLGTSDPEATAHKLEALYPPRVISRHGNPASQTKIAWESHQLARPTFIVPLEAVLDAIPVTLLLPNP
jgi:hypothetical protein